MTRTAWLPLLFVLIAACGDDDERTDCRTVPEVQNDVVGELAVQPSEGEPVHGMLLRTGGDGNMEIEFGEATVRMRRPRIAGTHDLKELEAKLCSFYWDDCVPVIGTIDVTIAEPTSIDAVIRVEGTTETREELSIAGTSRIVYRESTRELCFTYSSSSSTTQSSGCGGGGPIGRGSL